MVLVGPKTRWCDELKHAHTTAPMIAVARTACIGRPMIRAKPMAWGMVDDSHSRTGQQVGAEFRPVVVRQFTPKRRYQVGPDLSADALQSVFRSIRQVIEFIDPGGLKEIPDHTELRVTANANGC
jgi:hypothetical protein